MNRRQFAQSLVALGGSGFGLAAAAAGEGVTAVRVVHDTRVAAFDPLRLHERIEPANYHPFDGDVSRLWVDVLNHVWRDSRAATAGFTRHAEFFILRTLAREYGYRIAATDERADYLSWLLLSDRESGADPLSQEIVL